MEERLLKSMQLLKVTTEDLEQLEAATRGQSTCKVWKAERFIRLQSSQFGRIAKATSRTDFSQLAKSLLNPASFSTEATAQLALCLSRQTARSSRLTRPSVCPGMPHQVN
jgi:hypothetical protein